MEPGDIVYCPDALLSDTIRVSSANADDGLSQVETLLDSYPSDARLHFLRGSLLAGAQKIDQAQISMRQAIEIAPEFSVARFQLGFLQMTSADMAAAATTWRPLMDLPQDHYLRLFAEGLELVAVDDFDQGHARLRWGMAQNTENPAMNKDMQLLMSATKNFTPPHDSEPTSSAQLLLQEYANRQTKH